MILTVADSENAEALPALIATRGDVKRKHTLQFTCVESNSVGAGGIAGKNPKGLGGSEKPGLGNSGPRLAYA